jgi:amino acid adenylation domain-containing protein
MTSIPELFRSQVQKNEGAVAVEFGGERLSYGELDRRADAFARRLKALGVGPDVTVAVALPRSPHLVAVLLGVLKAGGAYLPLDLTHPRKRLAYILDDAQPAAVVAARPEDVAWLAGTPHKIVVGAEFEEAAPDHEPFANPAPTDLAYVIYTSGSTGAPKGVQVEHQSVSNLLASMLRRPGLDAGDAVLAVTTPAFDISVLELFAPLVCGGRIILAPDEVVSDGAALADLIERSRPTVVQATASTLRMLLDAGWTGDPGLKLLCGGEPWSASLAAELIPRCGSLWNMYGPTEATVWSAVGRIEAGAPVTIGRPILETRLYVLDHARQLVPVGVAGELYIAGAGLARGYLGREELTRERFLPDPFAPTPGQRMYRTGDLVRRLPTGAIEYLDRIDNQVKVRGHRVELAEIETALKSHPKVKEGVVVARDDPIGDKVLIACITTDAGETVDVSELRALLRDCLPPYMIPARFVVVDAFPLTPNGKLDRNALPPADSLQLPSATVAEKPRTTAERAIASIWCELLNVREVDRRDNFFDLGGHSLLATRCLERINRSLKVRVSVPAFFRDPTIEGLAREVVARSVGQPRVVRLRDGKGTPLYFIGAGPAESLLGRRMEIRGPTFDLDFPISSEWSRATPNAALPTVERLGELVAELLYPHVGAMPCVLAGYSMWGRIAFESARALKRRGGNVAMVLLLDAHALASNHSMRSAGARSWRWIMRRAREGRASPVATLRDTLRLGWWGLGRLPWYVSNRFLPKSRTSGYLDEAGAPVLQVDINRLNKAFDASYKPAPLDTAGVLLRAAVPGEAHLAGFDASNGWNGLFLAGLKVLQAEGDHLSMVRETNVDGVAKLINGVLETYERREAVKTDLN